MSCTKTQNEPTPAQKNVSIKKNKSSNLSLLTELVNNADFRNVAASLKTLDSLKLAKVLLLNIQSLQELSILVASFDNTKPLLTRLNAYGIDENVYTFHQNRIANGFINLHRELLGPKNLSQQAYADLIGEGFEALNDDIILFSPCDVTLGTCKGNANAKYQKAVSTIVDAGGSAELMKLRLNGAGNQLNSDIFGCSMDYAYCLFS